MNNPKIAIHKNILCKLLNTDVILSLIGLFLNIYFTINDAIKGITMNVIILFIKSINSILFELEKNINRYIGSNTNWIIKLMGNIDKLKATFPLLIFVNIKYQSVQGVNINITNPINKST